MRSPFDFAILGTVVVLAAPPAAARLTALSMTPGTVRIATDAAVGAATGFALATPFRLVVDLPGTMTDAFATDGAGSVARVRAAMFAPGTARIVIDLAAPLAFAEVENRPGELLVRLRRVDEAGFAAAVRRGRVALPMTAPPVADFDLPPGMFAPRPPRTATPPSAAPIGQARDAAAAPGDVRAAGTPPSGQPVEPRPAPTGVAADDGPGRDAALPDPAAPPPRPSGVPVRPRDGGRLPLVVIDAGHGGKDAGAISIDGGYEKDVTLAIARAAAKALARAGRVRVKLTRDDDRFIPLGGRVAIARAARADLFVSVHADSAPNAAARGASVYTLSAVASDAVAARLAARENKADIIGGLNLGGEAPEIGNILIDLSRRATGNVSVAFAETLQDELSSRMEFRGEFHHFAGFYVLKAPDVPSVLLETGYVSNAEDAAVLFSAAGRRRIGEGVARAVERHLLGR